MAAGTTEVNIKGLEGNFQAQPRVFAHSANSLTIPSGNTNSVDVYPSPPNDTNVLVNRGACLYVGGAGDVKVLLEGDTTPVTFKGIQQGTFLPILALKVYGTDTGQQSGGTSATEIIALF